MRGVRIHVNRRVDDRNRSSLVSPPKFRSRKFGNCHQVSWTLTSLEIDTAKARENLAHARLAERAPVQRRGVLIVFPDGAKWRIAIANVRRGASLHILCAIRG